MGKKTVNLGFFGEWPEENPDDFGGWDLPVERLKLELRNAQVHLDVVKNQRYRRIAAAAGAELLLPKAEYERNAAAREIKAK